MELCGEGTAATKAAEAISQVPFPRVVCCENEKIVCHVSSLTTCTFPPVMVARGSVIRDGLPE